MVLQLSPRRLARLMLSVVARSTLLNRCMGDDVASCVDFCLATFG